MQSTPVVTHHGGHEMSFCTECVCVCVCVLCVYDSSLHVGVVYYWRELRTVIYSSTGFLFSPSMTGGSSALQQTETDWDVRDSTPMPCESISSVSDKRHPPAVCLFQPSADVTDNQPDICCLHPLDVWRWRKKRETGIDSNGVGIIKHRRFHTKGMCLDERNHHFWSFQSWMMAVEGQGLRSTSGRKKRKHTGNELKCQVCPVSHTGSLCQSSNTEFSQMWRNIK